MIIFLHVTIALLSMGLSSYALFRPSTKVLRGSYGLAALTLASGMYMVWTTPGHMIQACLSGVAYLSVTLVAIGLARRKLTLGQLAAEQSTR